jgi:hypothetical protein
MSTDETHTNINVVRANIQTIINACELFGLSTNDAVEMMNSLTSEPLTHFDFGDLRPREKKKRVHDRRPWPGVKQKGY